MLFLNKVVRNTFDYDYYVCPPMKPQGYLWQLYDGQGHPLGLPVWHEQGYGSNPVNGLFMEYCHNVYNWMYVPPPYDCFCCQVWFGEYYGFGENWFTLQFNASDLTWQGKQLDWFFWNFWDRRDICPPGKTEISSPNQVNSMEMGDMGAVYGIIQHEFSTNDGYPHSGMFYAIVQADWRNGTTYNFGNMGSQFCQVPQWWNGWRQEDIIRSALVNRTLGRILIITDAAGMLWDYNRQEKLWEFLLPNSVCINVAWESDSYAWILFANNQVMKIDWLNYRRIEMVSSIQESDSPATKGQGIAYDTYRHRLVVMKWLDDSPYGMPPLVPGVPVREPTCAQTRFEIYTPVPKATTMTKPVPVTSTKKGINTTFAANLVGDMGEGIAGQLVTVSLVTPKNHGKILTPNVYTEPNGQFKIGYQGADSAPVDEEIQLSAEIADVIG